MAISISTNILATNQAAVIMDVNVYSCDKEDSTLFQIIDEVQFYEYPHCSGVGYSNFNVFPMDTVLVKAQFHVKQGTKDNPIILTKFQGIIGSALQNGIEEVELESFTINTGGFLPNCDNIQEIYFTQERDFILPTSDCRNEIQIFRMPTLDITGYSAYEFIYPFKVRWEDWRELQTPQGEILRCFPTPTQNWMIYANQSGWNIKFSIKAEVSVQNQPIGLPPDFSEFEHITWGQIVDPCEQPYSVEFNTFDSTGVNSFEEVIGKDMNTYVVATISGDFTGYTADQLYGILTLDAWGVGGVAYSQEIGTRIAVDDEGVWYGTGSTLKATLTKVSNNTLTLSAYINYLYLPTDTNQFILSARIGGFEEDFSSSGSVCLNETMIEEFTCGELQIIEVIDANTLVVSGELVTQELYGVLAQDMVLEFLTSTTWRITGGFISGNTIIFGTLGGNIIKAPAHPYTDANVGDTLQGDITGIIGSVLFEDENCPASCYLLLETGAPTALEGGGYVLLEECD